MKELRVKLVQSPNTLQVSVGKHVYTMHLLTDGEYFSARWDIEKPKSQMTRWDTGGMESGRKYQYGQECVAQELGDVLLIHMSELWKDS